MKSKADGDLLIQLDGKDANDYKAPRGNPPRAGINVTLWRLPGTWHIWSAGPQEGTWWLRAVDRDAEETAEALAFKPSRGAPVVKATWKDCIAVSSREIRRNGLR